MQPGGRGDLRVHNAAADSQTGGWMSAFSSWQFFSIACGLGAIVVAILLWLIPSNEWRAWIGGLLGLGIGVTALMMSMNPQFFYRRWLSYVIPAGLLINGLGFTCDVFFANDSAAGWFKWEGPASVVFLLAWAAVIGWLVWGDRRQNA